MLKYTMNPLCWVEKVCGEYVLIGTKPYRLAINIFSVLTRGEVAVLNDIKKGIDFDELYAGLDPSIKDAVIESVSMILDNLEKNGVISRVD